MARTIARATPGSRDARLALLLVAATLLVYLPALSAGFIWDDDSYVTGNPHLTGLDGLLRLWVPGSTPQYYPVVFTSFWLERLVFGLAPFALHLVNVALHAANALLVWRLLRRLAVPGAWLAAAVFALHPVHVESVAWVTERKNVLSGLFYLLAALAWLRFEETRDLPETQRREARPGRWYGAALGCFVLALLSKTVTCTLPVALALLSLRHAGRFAWRRLAPLLPFVALGLGLGLLTLHLERVQVGAQGADFDFSPAERLLIASRALVFYAQKLLVPWPLVFIYPRWVLAPSDPLAWWPLAVVLLGAAAAFLAWRRGRRGPALALAFFALTLFPALGFFDVYPMRYSFVADHFQYLASLGPIVLASSALARVRWRRAAAAAGLALLLVLGALTFRQARMYEDIESLWRETLRHNPGAWMAHTNLAKVLTERGQDEEALAHLQAALAAGPSGDAAEQIHFNVALTLGKLGRHAQAFDELQRVHAASGGMEVRLAQTLERLGRDDEAEARFRAALAGPRPGEALVPYAVHLLRRGRPEEAVPLLERVLADRPDDADALMFHADACAAAGRLDDALRSAGRALSLVRAAGDARTAALVERRMTEYRASR